MDQSPETHVLEAPEISPLRIELGLDPNVGGLSYRVDRDGRTLIHPTPIGVLLAGGPDLRSRLRLSGSAQSVCDERFTLPSGKTRQYRHRAAVLSLSLEKDGFSFAVEFLVFAEGMAFRFRFHEPVAIAGETTGMDFGSVLRGYGQEHTYIGPHGVKDRQNNESMQEIRPFPKMEPVPWFMPLLLELDAGRGWAWLSEGSLAETDGPAYCASHFRCDGSGRVHLQHDEAHGPDHPVSGVRRTPWRIALLSTDLAPIVESTAVEGLADPTIPGDFDWVRPGRVAWPWLTDHEWGNGTLEGMKTYIDLAREAGWEYFCLDVGWHEFEELWIPEVLEYARRQGVEIILWYEYQRLQTLEETEAVFQKITAWGVAGVKIDFVYDDVQEVQNYIIGALRLGARYRLLVNFHGITKPVGYRRTWPNLITREAVKGHEWYKNNAEDPSRHPFCPDSRHFCLLPFTRNVAGPMDETPLMLDPRARRFISTAQDVALLVLFETGLVHHGSHHRALRQCPAWPLLKACPAAWEETRLLGGHPGEWVLLARRADNQWFIAGITTEARSITLDLHSLLPGGETTAILYADGETSDDLRVASITVHPKRPLSIDTPRSGGFVLHLNTPS